MIHTANLTHSVSRKAGGLHESVRRLVQSLASLGVGVRVLTVEDEFTDVDLGAWDPVRVDVFPATWPNSFGYSPGFLKALSEERPDLTHTHGIWTYPSIATAAYCTRQRVPYMISPRNARSLGGASSSLEEGPGLCALREQPRPRGPMHSRSL